MAYIILLRPKDWAKNLFLFIPLFFAGKLFEIDIVLRLILGFIAVSLIASSVYILNDYKDIESDKLHPEKCKRPLASGAVTVTGAFILFFLCLAGGFLLAWSVDLKFLALLAIYFAMNVCYSMGLKNISILDILIIAIGFSLRLKIGAVIAHLPLTEWLTIMVFLLALFMAIAKRTDDMYIKKESGVEIRKSSKGYSMELLNILLAIVAAVIIITYMLYTLSPMIIARLGTYRLYYTSLFLVAGLFRYLQIVYINKDSGSPTKILYKDRFLQIVIFLWILSFYIILYLPKVKLFH
ncbi:MAG TPA: UbiA prenyltransferase family protein [Puia sp.]|nr:UbiA prenyltransferase family protein [Puia sp.]